MTNTNLIHAMGRIDPKLITDAAPDVEQKKQASKTWVKWASLAACFTLILCVCIPLAFYFNSDDIGLDDPNPFGTLTVGENKNYENGIVSYDEKKDNSITFTFIVNAANDTEYQLSKNYYIEYEENGKVTKSYKDSYGATEHFNILVDGKEIQIVQMGEHLEYDFSFLKTPGTYQITVDYSNLFEEEGRGVVLDMNFWGIVDFNVNDYEKIN